jgi:histidine triad (HIT) family protein
MAEEAENSNASQKQNCVFCRIIEGQIPSKKIYEDNVCIVILDINPAHVGHALILPKDHYQIMPQVPEKDREHLFKVSKHISNAMLKHLGVQGTSIFVANGAAAGQKAPHFMIHVIPRKEKDGLFQIPKRKVPEKDLEKIQELFIKKLSEKLGRVCVSIPKKGENIVDAEIVEESIEQEQKEMQKEKIDENNEQQETNEIEKMKEIKKPAKKETKKKITEKQEKPKKEVNIDDIANMFLNR